MIRMASNRRVARAAAILTAAVLVGGCGLIPGSDRAGDASVPAFPVATAPPPARPTPQQELDVLTAQRSATTTTAPIEEVIAEAEGYITTTTAPRNAGDGSGVDGGVTQTTLLDVGNLSEQCLALYRLTTVAFRLYDENPLAEPVRRESLFHQVVTEIDTLVVLSPSNYRAALQKLSSEAQAFDDSIPFDDTRTFSEQLDAFVAARGDVMNATLAPLFLTCPSLEPFNQTPIPSFLERVNEVGAEADGAAPG